MLETIQKEIEKLEIMLLNAKNEISSLPKGTLRCSLNKKTYQYYVDGEYKSKKEIDLIKGIAQREYDEKVIPIIEKTLQKLYGIKEMYAKRRIDNCYQLLCEARKQLITPLILPMEEAIKKFLSEEFPPGEFDEKNISEFYTSKGERVRSKSELLIAEQLCRYRIPYRYEKPIKLWDGSRIVVCRPDFTVMNKRNRKIYLYEHLGMMDDKRYVEQNMRKLDLYEKNGYLLGKNLIITRETNSTPLNPGIIEAYIKEYFM